VKLTRAGEFALMLAPVMFVLGYFTGGIAATESARQKQETYNTAYQWCANHTPDPEACQWGAYKVLNP
jgi:hypothetical protein